MVMGRPRKYENTHYSYRTFYWPPDTTHKEIWDEFRGITLIKDKTKHSAMMRKLVYLYLLNKSDNVVLKEKIKDLLNLNQLKENVSPINSN